MAFTERSQDKNCDASASDARVVGRRLTGVARDFTRLNIVTTLICDMVVKEARRIRTQNTIELLEDCLRKKNPSMANFFLGSLKSFLADITEFKQEMNGLEECQNGTPISRILAVIEADDHAKQRLVSALEEHF